MSTPILDLATLVPERPIVRIDGTAYEMALPEDFGLVATGRIMRAIEAVKALTDDDDASLELAASELRAVTGLVLRAPPEVIDKLTDWQRISVVETFSKAVGTRQTAPPNRQARRRTGARSSPTSVPSTVPSRG